MTSENPAVLDIGSLTDSIRRLGNVHKGQFAGQGTTLGDSAEQVHLAWVLEPGSFSGTIKLKLRYTLQRQQGLVGVEDQLLLRATQPGFGGQRWWLTCPDCRERRSKLYLSPRREHFSCSDCERERDTATA